MFKSEWNFENFLDILPFKLRKYYCKMRMSNHRLPVEIGRQEGISLNDRKCLLCNLNEIGDEYHYIMKCPFFLNDRRKYLPSFCSSHPSAYKITKFMQ